MPAKVTGSRWDTYFRFNNFFKLVLWNWNLKIIILQFSETIQTTSCEKVFYIFICFHPKAKTELAAELRLIFLRKLFDHPLLSSWFSYKNCGPSKYLSLAYLIIPMRYIYSKLYAVKVSHIGCYCPSGYLRGPKKKKKTKSPLFHFRYHILPDKFSAPYDRLVLKHPS